MKRIIAAVICAIVATCCILPMSVFAESASVSGSSTATAGGTVSVSVNASGSEIIGMQANINYDTSKLQYKSISSGISGWKADFANGKIVVTDETGEGAFSGTKTVAVITFSVLSNASGSSDVTLSSAILSKGAPNFESVSAGGNTHSINISAPVTTAAPTTAPKTTASTAANLKSLSVNGYTLNPKFSQSRTSYTVQIPKDLTSIDVTATPLNADSKVTITGDKNFTAGQSNTIKILVKAADGTTKTYTIKTVFEAETTVPVTQKVNLTNLKLRAATDIKFAFVPTTYEYTVTVPKGTTSLNVDAIADQIEGAIVSVTGADDLKASNNKVVITVTSPDGTQTVYTINVKYASDEVATPETKGGLPAWAVILIALASFIAGGFALGYVIYVVLPKRKNNHPDDLEDDDYDDDNNDDNNSNSGNTGASGGYTPGEYSFVHSADD